MKTSNITLEAAEELLHTYIDEPSLLRHCQVVSGVMAYFADKLGYNDELEYWTIVGLLHDIDFQKWPEEHCIKSQTLLREHGVNEDIIYSTASHGYGMVSDLEPQHEMEKVLFAIDELTGLISATALMRPSKSVSDLSAKSVKKKYKQKSFAAGCSREVIQKGADALGWYLDDLIEQTIIAMQCDPEN